MKKGRICHVREDLKKHILIFITMAHVRHILHHFRCSTDVRGVLIEWANINGIRILKFFVWKKRAWGPGPLWEAGGFSTTCCPNAALPLGMKAGFSLVVANSCRNEPFQIKDPFTTTFAPQEGVEIQVGGSTLQLEFVLMGLNSHLK